MNGNENKFESLRRWLVLKRHETPPPGYFDHFSAEVVARLRAGERDVRSGALENVFGEAAWVLRLIEALQAKPMFAGGFATAVGLLLILGVVYADRPETPPQPLLQPAPNVSALAVVSPSDLNSQQSPFISGTNPVPSLFDLQTPLVQPVSFTPGNN